MLLISRKVRKGSKDRQDILCALLLLRALRETSFLNYNMEITGKLLQLLPLQTGQGKNGTWKKQEFIIETGDTYPKKVCLAIWGDKIDISKVTPGTTVTLQFDAESREYNGRWYTDLRVYGLKT